MKQLTKATKDYSNNAKIVAAVEHFMTDLNATADTAEGSHFRFATRWSGKNRSLVAGTWGQLDLIDTQAESEQNNYGMVVWENNGELFVVPGFAEDGWSNINANGMYYMVNGDEQPVIIED